MSQLLVRKVDPHVVRQLKLRARSQNVSAEEAHRRILSAALIQDAERKRSLIEFLQTEEVAPETELELTRSREIEERDIGI